MPLASGTRIGAYEVISAIGAGGMGEVYRARDAKLHRDVALKVLPDVFANDAERLARFARESQVLASLNHQNIAHVYGFEEAGSARALVMELVEGQTLDERIAAGPLPIDDALGIARQIAEGLEAAHDLGIVHRDLKPSNVMIRDDGTVKILDFGLAKSTELQVASSVSAVGRAQSPTITTPAMTMQGVVLGTAPYMAPEQAKGRVVDRRTDIWAFGCVVYEILSGTRAFDGEDAADTIAAVLTKDPDWSALPKDLPPRVTALIRSCFERDPRRRVSSMAIVRWELAAGLVAEPAAPAQVSSRSSRWPPVLAAVVTIAAVAAIALWAPWRRADSEPSFKFSVDLGVDASLLPVTNVGGIARGVGTSAVLSPDGRVLAFVARSGVAPSQLYVRFLDQLSATPLPGTTNAAAPFFSPNGQWVAFFADGKLKKVSVSGGLPTTLCDVPSGRGGSWGDDDTIVFTPSPLPGSTVMRVPAAGGVPEPLTKLGVDEAVHRWAQVLPRNAGVMFTASTSNTGPYDGASIAVLPRAGAAPKVVYQGGSQGRYVASGHLLFASKGTLYAVPFDLEKLETRGRPVPVLEGVSYSGDNGAAQFSVSETGVLAYALGPPGTLARSIDWIDRAGTASKLRSTPSAWSQPRFSPDGKRIALTSRSGTEGDIWLLDWERDVPTRLTFGGSDNFAPEWTPDGEGIAFVSNRDANHVRNIYWQRADGSGAAVPLTTGTASKGDVSWHPSGRFVAFSETRSFETKGDVMVMPIDGSTATGLRPGSPAQFVASPAHESRPRFSPDGKWLLYESDESGQTEVYVQPFPGPGAKWRLSTSGGAEPQWSRGRSELLYRTLDRVLMVLPYQAAEGAFRAGKLELWSGKPVLMTNMGWAVHPDGNRLVMESAEDTVLSPLNKVTIVTRFFDELRRLAPLP